MMEVLEYDMSLGEDDGSQMITLADVDDLNDEGNTSSPLVHHVLDSAQMPSSSHNLTGSSPCCLVCNAKLGVSARGAMNIFSNQVKTSHRQLGLKHMIGTIVHKELTSENVHSDILCKKCFKLLDDIDSLENQADLLKDNFVTKYKRTLSVIKQESEMSTQSDGLDLEEDSALAKDDKDFRVYMPTGTRGRKHRRGRVRRTGPPLVRLREENEDELLGLNAVSTSEVFQNQDYIKSKESQDNDAIQRELVGVSDLQDYMKGKEPRGSDATPREIIGISALQNYIKSKETQDKQTTPQELINVSVKEKAAILMMEELLSAGGVMEVDPLDFELPGLCTINATSLEADDSTSSNNQNSNLVLQEKFKCKLCSLETSSRSAIQFHMKEVHSDSLIQCEVCSEDLPSQDDLLEHLKQHIASGKKPYDCKICTQSFALPRQLKEHQKVHISKNASLNLNRPFKCNECDKKFTTKHILRSHMKTHGARDRPHQCEQCKKSFYTTHHLTEHVKVHDRKKSFICDNCGKGFATQRSLDLHNVTHTGIKKFSCSICNKTFARKNEVDNHERTHTGEKPFQCEICGATFCQRSNLQSHKKATHFEEKRYKCQHCPKAFKRRRLLVYHEMSRHTGERPYKCDHCQSSFVYPEHHRKHLRIHTGEKPFKCDICGKAFNSRDNRNAHKFIHSDKKPYECKLCGNGFMRRPMIVSHIQVHNVIDDINSYIKINPPSVVEIIPSAPSPTMTDQSMKVEDESIDSNTIPIIRETLTSGDVDVSRPVTVLEEFPRYIIQTGGGDRCEDSIGTIFPSLQVVEFSGEHLNQVVTEQISGTGHNTPAVTISGDLRPFQIQLDSRELIDTEHSHLIREGSVISTTNTGLTQGPTSNSITKHLETRESFTLRKILSTDKDVIASDVRATRNWPNNLDKTDYPKLWVENKNGQYWL